VALNHISVRLV